MKTSEKIITIICYVMVIAFLAFAFWGTEQKSEVMSKYSDESAQAIIEAGWQVSTTIAMSAILILAFSSRRNED
jgi:hypothetical protein